MPSDVGPLPKSPKLRALDPGAMLVVVARRDVPQHSSSAPVRPTAGAAARAAGGAYYDRTTGLGLLQAASSTACRSSSRCRPCSRASSSPDNCRRRHAGAPLLDRQAEQGDPARLPAPAHGEYWGIEETNMPDPPILADKSFQRDIKRPRVPALLHGLEPAHGRAARPRRELLGRQHAARRRSRTRR